MSRTPCCLLLALRLFLRVLCCIHHHIRLQVCLGLTTSTRATAGHVASEAGTNTRVQACITDPISDIFTEIGVPINILLQPEVPVSGSDSAGLHPAQPMCHIVYAATVVPGFQAVGPAAMQHCYHQRLCQALGLRQTGRAAGDDGAGDGSAAAHPTAGAASADAGPGLLLYSNAGKQALQSCASATSRAVWTRSSWYQTPQSSTHVQAVCGGTLRFGCRCWGKACSKRFWRMPRKSLAGWSHSGGAVTRMHTGLSIKYGSLELLAQCPVYGFLLGSALKLAS